MSSRCHLAHAMILYSRLNNHNSIGVMPIVGLQAHLCSVLACDSGFEQLCCTGICGAAACCQAEVGAYCRSRYQSGPRLSCLQQRSQSKSVCGRLEWAALPGPGDCTGSLLCSSSCMHAAARQVVFASYEQELPVNRHKHSSIAHQSSCNLWIH